MSSIRPDWLRDGKAHLFVRFTSERPREMPESAEFVNDFASTEDQKDLLEVLDAVDEVGRPFVMSTEVPPDRLAIMRKAFDDTMKDTGFLAEAEKQRLPIHPLSGDDVARVVTKMATVPPAVIARARKIYE